MEDIISTLKKMNIACDPNPLAMFKIKEPVREKVLLYLMPYMSDEDSYLFGLRILFSDFTKGYNHEKN